MGKVLGSMILAAYVPWSRILTWQAMFVGWIGAPQKETPPTPKTPTDLRGPLNKGAPVNAKIWRQHMGVSKTGSLKVGANIP